MKVNPHLGQRSPTRAIRRWFPQLEHVPLSLDRGSRIRTASPALGVIALAVPLSLATLVGVGVCERPGVSACRGGVVTCRPGVVGCLACSVRSSRIAPRSRPRCAWELSQIRQKYPLAPMPIPEAMRVKESPLRTPMRTMMMPITTAVIWIHRPMRSSSSWIMLMCTLLLGEFPQHSRCCREGWAPRGAPSTFMLRPSRRQPWADAALTGPRWRLQCLQGDFRAGRHRP